MLNRRILRVKAFKLLYACALRNELKLEDALSSLDDAVEATRDEYLFLLCLIPAITEEAARRTRAAMGKFNPTPEELNPNLKFVNNSLAPLLAGDPDFQRIIQKKDVSWDQADAFLFKLWDSIKAQDWFLAYMSRPSASLAEDAALFIKIFENLLEDDEDLAAILEDRSIYWSDDLPYALICCVRSLEQIARTGRYELPPLYQSDILRSQGKQVDSDRDFVRKLVSACYSHMEEYNALIAGTVPKWDRDRLYTTDIVIISMGLAEAVSFPEIPVKVTINEYVEISKYYSTPKSHGFVNGIMDSLIKQLLSSGQIVKQGKGLN